MKSKTRRNRRHTTPLDNNRPDKDDRGQFVAKPGQDSFRARPPAEGHVHPPASSWWDRADALVDRICSRGWRYTSQVVFLLVVIVALAAGLLLTVHAAVSVPVVLASGLGGLGVAARARSRGRSG